MSGAEATPTASPRSSLACRRTRSPVTGSRSRCGACIVSAAGRPLAWGVHRSLAPNFEGNAKCKARERAARALSPFACLIHSRVAQVADIHAEADALAHAARAGARVAGASCYVTKPPCVRCAAQLAAAGIVRCGYSGQLRAHFDERVSCAVEAVAQAAGMALVEGVTLLAPRRCGAMRSAKTAGATSRFAPTWNRTTRGADNPSAVTASARREQSPAAC